MTTNENVSAPAEVGANWLPAERASFNALLAEAVTADNRWSAVLIAMICRLAMAKHPIINRAWLLGLAGLAKKAQTAVNTTLYTVVLGYTVAKGVWYKRQATADTAADVFDFVEKNKISTAFKRMAPFLETVARLDASTVPGLLGEIAVSADGKWLTVPGTVFDPTITRTITLDGKVVTFDGDPKGQAVTMGSVIVTASMASVVAKNAPKPVVEPEPAMVPKEEVSDADGNVVTPAPAAPADAPKASTTTAPAPEAVELIGNAPPKAWSATTIPTITRTLRLTVHAVTATLSEAAKAEIESLVIEFVTKLGPVAMHAMVEKGNDEIAKRKADDKAAADKLKQDTADAKAKADADALALLATKPVEPKPAAAAANTRRGKRAVGK